MDKPNWRAKVAYILFALALVFGLGAAVMPLQTAEAGVNGLSVTITDPTDGAEFDPCTYFAVRALVKNEGETTRTDVIATLTIGGNAEFVSGDGPEKSLGDISPGSTQEANWTLHCTGPGDVTITVTAGCASDSITVVQRGLEELAVTLHDPVDDEVCVCDDFPVSATVINTGNTTINGVQAQLTVTGQAHVVSANPVSVGSLAPGASQVATWTLHCDGAAIGDCPVHSYVDVKADAWGTGDWSGTTVDATQDVENEFVDQKWLIVDITTPQTCTDFCLEDEFFVDATVRNCFDEAVTGTVLITLDPGSGAHVVTPPEAMQNLTVPAGETVGIPFAWHLHCDAPGDLAITVKFLGIAGTTTLCDEDTVTVHQKDPAALGVSISVDKDCVGVCDNFKVTATITNTGGVDAATATNVTATIHASGDITLQDPPSTKSVDDIPGGDYREVTWTFHCDGPADAQLWVSVSGTDEVCGGTVSATSGWEYVEQVDLDVEIITPADSTTYSTCQTFCVTANLTNNETAGNIIVDFAKIVIDANASLVTGESAQKPAEGDITVLPGQTQQVSWTVHCNGSGDSVITVEAHVISPCGLVILDTITVHQEQKAALEVEILSPDCSTFVATSQDFAVTAKVTNTGEANAINVDAMIEFFEGGASVAEGAEVQNIGVIAGGTSEIVTWTVHCDGSGPTDIVVSAVGQDENSLDQVASEEDFVMVWQYPAAHLEVTDITVDPEPPYEVCTEFTVTATVVNTGEADATEVTATLSVFPEGSARITEGGYTQQIGTLAGHGQDGTATVTWNMHCKQACDSTITITLEGYDEYGWHQKQECQSTGMFAISGGGYHTFPISGDAKRGEIIGEFEGEAYGLIGPFLVQAEFYVETIGHPELYGEGHASLAGFVTPDMLFFMGKLAMSEKYGTVNDAYQVLDDPDEHWGLLEVINGQLIGSFYARVLYPDTEISVVFSEGTYCSTMASTPGLAILDRFIEPMSITVKQLELLPPEEVTEVALNEGWNLMSLALMPDPDNPEDLEVVLADILANVDKVWSYEWDGTTAEWLWYSGGAGPLDTMTDGKGYWVIMTDPDTLPFAGVVIPAPPGVPPTYYVYEGWNLMGFKSTTPRLAGDYLAALGETVTIIYGYADGFYFIVESTDFMEPGLGYWIAVTEDGTIYP